MLQAHSLNKSYGVQILLDDVTFSLQPDDRVGLIGPNGSGKSTLLRLLTREELPDGGSVFLAPGAALGYLPQGVDRGLEREVRQYILDGIPGLAEAHDRLEELSELIAREPSAQNLDAFGEVQHRYETLGGYQMEGRMEAVLAGLGLTDVRLDDRMAVLSGGQRTRVGLARLLTAQPEVLLLDEPTNHLDIEALEWLEGFLRTYKGAVLVVSHDRRFLDRTVRRILELNPDTHSLREYTGGYSEYERTKALELEAQWDDYRDQQAEIRRLTQDVRRTKEHAMHTERSTNNDHLRRLAKKVAQRAKAKEKRLQRYMESDERVERPDEAARMRLRFSPSLRSGQDVVSLEEAGREFGGRWLYRGVDQTLRYGERVALVGPNGSGKTTLLRLIMGELEPSEGRVRVGASVRFGYMPQQQEVLDPRESALETIQHLAAMNESEVFNFLQYFLIYEDKVRLPSASLSYGERSRLMLARLVVSGANCLLLDEPINHLDIPSRQQFETALESFPGAVLVSVHDRAFIDRFAHSLWRLGGGGLRKEYLRLPE